MNERERIQALLQAGKITPQEADLLLSALDEGDEAASQADQALNETVGNPQYQPTGQSGQATQPTAYAASGWSPQGLRWVKVRLTAGQLEAKLDPSLQAPLVEGGQAEVREVGQDLEVTPQLVRSSFLGGLLNGMGVGTVELRLPPGWGLDIDSKAAQVEVEGVAFLRGRVAAGNVELEGVGGLDLDVTAGNIDGSLLLTDGSHRLKVSMGNADIDLLEGSSAKVSAGVSMGNLELRGFQRQANGHTPTPQVGDGRAKLDLAVRMGNLEVRAR